MSRVHFAGDKVEFGAHPAIAASLGGATSSATAAASAVPTTTATAIAAGPGHIVIGPQPRESAPPTSGTALACNTCKEHFASLEELRRHFDSALHVRNIRARVEGAPTMDRVEFRRAQLAAGGGGGAADDNDDDGGGDAGTSAGASTSAAGAQVPIFTCNLCKRTYRSAQTLQSHLRSTEHLMRKEAKILARTGSEAASALTSTSLGSAALGLHRRHKAHRHHRQGDVNANAADGGAAAAAAAAAGDKQQQPLERVLDAAGNITHRPPAAVVAARVVVPLEDREADVTPTRCLFSGYQSATVDANLDFMTAAYGFSIPMRDRVKDIDALMEYLCRKVNACICLVCGENTKRYATLEALRSHMRAANHERIELSPEYQEFYTCALDDGRPAALNRVDDGGGMVVVVGTGGARVLPREAAGGVARTLRETATERDQRRLLVAARVEENAVMLRDRAELLAPQRKEERRLQGQQRLRQQRQAAKISIRAGILHPKGFDGEGEFN